MGPVVLGGSPFAVKTLAEKKAIPPIVPSTSRMDEDKPSFSKSDKDGEKSKAKEKKEKKVDKKEHAKKKPKEKPPKEKPPKEKKEGKVKLKAPEKTKAEKKVKTKVGKEKEKKKGKEEKKKDDSIPKITVKLGSTPKPSATKILFKALAQGSSPPDPFAASPPSSPVRARSPSPPVLAPVAAPPPPQPQTSGRGSKASSKASKGAAAAPPASQQPQLAEAVSPLPTARMVITETVGTIVDERGNKIWICPACARPDDGSPMIGCDECDDWYHWVCVGIVVPPKEEESWYCNRCIAKRQGALAKKKKKKHRKDK